MTIHFRPQDPLRVLTQEVVFSEGKKEEQEEEEEEEKKDRERLLQIWKSFFGFESGAKIPRRIVLKKPLLKAIAKKLNSSTLQDEIYEKILIAEHGSFKDREEGEALIKNLESINAKIDKANSSWFRRIPSLL